MTQQLTQYELACGYIQRTESNNRWVTLWQEHGVYHVRAHDFNEHRRLAWDSFTALGKARAAFNRMRRDLIRL